MQRRILPSAINSIYDQHGNSLLTDPADAAFSRRFTEIPRCLENASIQDAIFGDSREQVEASGETGAATCESQVM